MYGNWKIDEVKTARDMIAVTAAPSWQARDRRWRPIPVTLIASIIGMMAYAAYERIGTTANADIVEFTQNLASGFLAIGMTANQPGFMVLSALDQEKVGVSATQVVSHVAGTHTVVKVQTPRDTTSIRLRGPQVILVSEDGAIERHDIDWTVAEFDALREAADCSHEAAVKKHRCGAPFTDLQEDLTRWAGERVPECVRAFLMPFRDHRSHH